MPAAITRSHSFLFFFSILSSSLPFRLRSPSDQQHPLLSPSVLFSSASRVIAPRRDARAWPAKNLNCPSDYRLKLPPPVSFRLSFIHLAVIPKFICTTYVQPRSLSEIRERERTDRREREREETERGGSRENYIAVKIEYGTGTYITRAYVSWTPRIVTVRE